MGEPDRLFTQQGHVRLSPRERTMSTKSQAEKILAHLKTGKTISPLEALERFGCFRLGGRIYDLKKQGHVIETKTVTKNGKHYAEYRLTALAGNHTEQ